mgnify:CR=1 FL=1
MSAKKKTTESTAPATEAAEVEQAAPAPAARMIYRVEKVGPAGYWKIGRMRIYPTAEVPIATDQAAAINEQLPGALVLIGV